MPTFLSKRWVLTVGFALFSCTSLPAQNGGTFKNPPIIPTATDVVGIATADLNQDGKPDLVYVDGSTSHAVHVLLGNGDQTFTHGQDTALDSGICCTVTLADVTGDGKIDIVLQGGGETTGIVAVLVGNGDGTFKSPVTSTWNTTMGGYPSFRGAAGVGDVNSDGKTDLVVDDFLNGTLYVLAGDGTGKFALLHSIQTYEEGVVYLADLNGDHHLDVVSTDVLGARFFVFIGNGDGTFQNYVAYNGQPGTGTLLLTDLDGDGHLDMVSQWYPSNFGFFKGNADGTFSPLQTISSVSTTYGLANVADFNGDGKADLNFTTPAGVGVALSTGGLNYDAAKQTVSGGPSTIYITLAKPVAADFNDDGKFDLAMPVEGGIAILIGKGDGTFASADSYDVGQIVGASAVADFNNDGKLDIAVAVPASFPKVLLGNGAGSFTLATDQNSSYGSQTPAGFLNAADFDGDKNADLLSGPSIYGAPGAQIFAEFGAGNATFSQPTAITNGAPVIADVNHDGRADIIALNGSIEVSLGTKSKSFTTVSTTLRLGTSTTLYNVGDVNKDGNPDLVINYADHLEIWLGKGDGTFAYSSSIVGAGISYEVVAAVADVDGDGNADIVLAPTSNAQLPVPPLEILYGNGDATFQAAVAVPVSHLYSQVVVADLNGDKKPDLVMSDGGSVAVLINEGNRSFANEVDYVAGGQVSALNVVDVNGDGLPDVVASNPGGTTVAVLLNQKGGTTGTISGTFTVSPEPSAFGQTITLSLTLVGDGTGTPVPTGTASFTVDGTFVATKSLVNGAVSYSYPNQLIPTAHTIIAEYNGDKNYMGETFSTQHVVEPPTYTTTTTLTANPSTVLSSQTVRLTAQVASTPAVAGGDVTFMDGTNSIGAALVNTSGIAYLDTATLAPGPHSLTAIYDGFNQVGFTDGNQSYVKAIFATSTSAAAVEAVNADPTTTGITFSPSAPAAGAVVTFTSNVSSTQGVPFGGATFFDGTVNLGTIGLASDGTVTFSTASLAAGSHSVTTVFNANGPYAGSRSAPATFTISAAAMGASAAYVTMSVSNGGQNSDSNVSAHVTASMATPGVEVTFLDSGAILGKAPLQADGTATLTIKRLTSGVHSLTASFAGGEAVGPSVSPALMQAWPSSGPGFDVSLGSSVAAVGKEGSATVEVAVPAFSGFAQPAQLACVSGLPSGYSCYFSPAAVNAGGKSTLTIRKLTGMSRGAFVRTPGVAARNLTLALCAVLALGLMYMSFGKRRPLVFQAAMLALTIAAIASCSGNSSISGALGPSVVSIRATAGSGSGAIIHDIQICVTFSQQK